MKPTTPNGTLPIAKLSDGSFVSESGAIGRAIAGASGMLGHGKEYVISEMLLGITSDLNQKAMKIAPTVFTKDNFDSEKKQAYQEGRGAVIEFADTKYEKFLIGAGDRFTESGLTFGEVISSLSCIATQTVPSRS